MLQYSVTQLEMNGQQTIVINDLLCFTLSKFGKIPLKFLLYILKDFYSNSEAIEANNRLITCLEIESKEIRRKLKKLIKFDPFISILKMLASCDQVDLPTFVCINLNNIPHIRGAIYKRYIMKKEHVAVKKKVNELYSMVHSLREQFQGIFIKRRKAEEDLSCTKIDKDGICKIPDAGCKKLQYPLKIAKKNSNSSMQRKYTCYNCKLIFESFKELIIHKKIHEKNGFSCPLCSKLYSKENWLNHVSKCYENRSGVTPPMIHCEICQIYFSNVKLLRIHKSLHDHSRPFQCQYCHFRFYSEKSLVNHHRKHIFEKQFKLKCHFCPKAFPASRKLEYHIRVHTGERPFKCELCDFCSTRHSGLQAHYKSHSNVKDFNCTICLRSFKFKSKLELHQKTHMEDRPYICQYCGRGFKTGRSMTIHNKSHLNSSVLPYLCTIRNCSYGTRSIIAFHDHTNCHFNIKPYACHFCNFVANQKSYLQAHLKKCILANPT